MDMSAGPGQGVPDWSSLEFSFPRGWSGSRPELGLNPTRSRPSGVSQDVIAKAIQDTRMQVLRNRDPVPALNRSVQLLSEQLLVE